MRTLRLFRVLELAGLALLLAAAPAAAQLGIDANASAGLQGAEDDTEASVGAGASASLDTEEDGADGNATTQAPPAWLLPGDAVCELTTLSLEASLSCHALGADGSGDLDGQLVFPGLALYGTWTVGHSGVSVPIDVLTLSSWADRPGDADGHECSDGRCKDVRAHLAAAKGQPPEKGLMATLAAALLGEAPPASAEGSLGASLSSDDVLAALALESGTTLGAYFDAAAGTLWLPTASATLAIPVAWQASAPAGVTVDAWAATAFAEVPCVPDTPGHSPLFDSIESDVCELGEAGVSGLAARVSGEASLALDQPLTDPLLDDADKDADGRPSDASSSTARGEDDRQAPPERGAANDPATTDEKDETAGEKEDGGVFSGIGRFFKKMFNWFG